MLRQATIWIVTICILVVQCPIAMAQSKEEFRILQLFYDSSELVLTASRYPKPISQVNENISTITAEEIEMMNAHSVAEILMRTPGLFISFSRDFGGISLIGIQGAEERHTLVLLDGIPWNHFSDGHAEVNTIPVGIIDRIEIIEGPLIFRLGLFPGRGG